MSISRYILPFLLVIISGLMVVLYIKPTYQDVLILRDKRADYETAINNAGEVRDLQAKLLAEAESIDETDRRRLEKLLPPSHDPVLVLYDLNMFAQQRGLTLKSPSVTISEQEKASGDQPAVLSTSIKFNVSAPYSIFRAFLADLEKELSLRDIKTLKISSEGTDMSRGLVESSVFTYEVEVVGYAYQGKSAVKDTASTQ